MLHHIQARWQCAPLPDQTCLWCDAQLDESGQVSGGVEVSFSGTQRSLSKVATFACTWEGRLGAQQCPVLQETLHYRREAWIFEPNGNFSEWEKGVAEWTCEAWFAPTLL